jgi:hypothetical protein
MTFNEVDTRMYLPNNTVTPAGRNSQYVGESVQPFNKRMNGHRSDLTKKTLLSQHSVSSGHLLDDDEIYQLAKNQALAKKLKKKQKI